MINYWLKRDINDKYFSNQLIKPYESTKEAFRILKKKKIT